METNTVGMRLIRIPPGSFSMGSSSGSLPTRRDDERAHQVRITRPFSIAEKEVTLEQYQRVMGRYPVGSNLNPVHDTRIPVTRVSWEDATEFCRKLSQSEHRTYRLPTEAEWEYACRAGTPTEWAGDNNPDAMAWHRGNSRDLPHVTGTAGWNHWGLYDMHGNVAEWCLDNYVANYPQTTNDPVVLLEDPRAPRVIRGGSFCTWPAFVRSAARDFLSPDTRRLDVGFRVVLDESAPAPASAPASRPTVSQ
jgi:formylglycine-generating enzyme required for sulfatase activity